MTISIHKDKKIYSMILNGKPSTSSSSICEDIVGDVPAKRKQDELTFMKQPLQQVVNCVLNCLWLEVLKCATFSLTLDVLLQILTHYSTFPLICSNSMIVTVVVFCWSSC